ncbi:PDZ domain-containing protein, partial [Granulosicoccus sp.]|nr:PDZ domain-containing protein [Granulosicoccus sp.]
MTIASIIPGSEAELAGVQVGDIIFSYANSRVFTTGELQSATRAGNRGELITLQVDRQGQS